MSYIFLPQVEMILNETVVTHSITHYHYTQWPDHSVPSECWTLAQMLHLIVNSHEESKIQLRSCKIVFIITLNEILSRSNLEQDEQNL